MPLQQYVSNQAVWERTSTKMLSLAIQSSTARSEEYWNYRLHGTSVAKTTSKIYQRTLEKVPFVATSGAQWAVQGNELSWNLVVCDFLQAL